MDPIKRGRALQKKLRLLQPLKDKLASEGEAVHVHVVTHHKMLYLCDLPRTLDTHHPVLKPCALIHASQAVCG